MASDGGVAACGGAFDRRPIPAASASSMDCELCLSKSLPFGSCCELDRGMFGTSHRSNYAVGTTWHAHNGGCCTDFKVNLWR